MRKYGVSILGAYRDFRKKQFGNGAALSEAEKRQLRSYAARR